ncbi:hypothetical protein BH09PSE5_BH09PSE5_25170 [soil metagenome]
MAYISQRTVLFADLRGSTSLYERLGNAEATTVVTHSVALLAQVVTNCGGIVIKTLGDGLMAVFDMPGAGIQAADEMHESLERIVSRGTVAGSAGGTGRMPALKLQVALAHGEIVEMAGDCFGDAVNVAARLLGHAGDNETLATVTVLQGLNLVQRNRFRSLDRMQLRGRSEPVHVYLLEARRDHEDVAPSTLYGDLTPNLDPEGIRLVWLNANKVFAGQSMPVVLGRSPQATYCIDDSRVSRSHARIDWHGGTFQLTDLSYNGTYVRFDNDETVVSLRRGTCTLHGAGVIGLGSAPVDATSPSLRFEVLRFPETLPQSL